MKAFPLLLGLLVLCGCLRSPAPVGRAHEGDASQQALRKQAESDRVQRQVLKARSHKARPH